MVRQRRQPCQKHPSTNTATRERGKTISGLPGNADECPRCQPRIPAPANRPRSLSSVDRVPLDRLRPITRDRVALSNLSKQTHLKEFSVANQSYRVSSDEFRG